MSVPIRILYYDDHPIDREFIRTILGKEHGRFLVTEVTSLTVFEQCLVQGQYDLLLADDDPHGFKQFEILDIARARNSDLPVILLGSNPKFEFAVEAMKRGAVDFLIRSPGQFIKLPQALQEVFERCNHRSSGSEKNPPVNLQPDTRRLKQENIQDIVFRIRLKPSPVVEYISPAVTPITGYSPEDFYSDPALLYHLIYPSDLPVFESAIRNEHPTDSPVTLRMVRQNGTFIWVEQRIIPVFDSGGNLALVEAVCRDITGRKRTEQPDEHTLNRQLKELTVLQAVASAASVAASEEKLIQDITRIIRETFELSNLTVGFLDQAAGVLRCHPSSQFTDTGREFTVSLGEGIAGWVATHGQPRRIPDVGREPDSLVVDSHSHSVLCVPIQTSTQVIGVMNAESEKQDAFSEADEGLMLTLMGQLAASIERIRLFEQTQRQARELAGLYNTALAMNNVLETESLLRRIYEQVQQLFDLDTFIIALFEEGSQDFEIALGMENGQVISEWAGKRISLDNGGLTGWVIRTRQTLLIGDLENGNLPANPIHGTRPARSWLGVPLISRDQVTGVISVQSFQPNAFDETHRRFLESMAGQVAVALENARLFNETRRRLDELEAVNKVSAAIRSAQTLDEMLSCLIDETLSTIGTQAGEIWLYDISRDELRRSAVRGWFSQLPGGPIRRGEHPAWKVIEKDEILACREFSSDPRFSEYLNPLTPAGWGGCCIPIRVASEITGVFFVSVPLPREFNPGELHFLVTLSELAGNAIHRMRLHNQTERRLQHLGALHVIDMAISASVDLRITLSILLEQVTTQLHVDAADIMLYNSYLQSLEYSAGRGFRSKPVDALKLRLGEGYAGRAALEHRIITVTKLSRTGQTAPLPGMWAGENFVTYYAVPLIAKGQVKGVLNIYHRSPLDPDPEWMNFLETMSTQAAIAIETATTFDNLQRANVDLALAYDATLEGWSRAQDLRDHETEVHAKNVSEMTLRLAQALGVKDNELIHIRRGALLHDIGKVGIPDRILLKPDKLSDEEWVIMKKHPLYAYELLSPIFYLYPALDIPYCHHEKWDGTGYPRGLKGEHIPLAARIFAVADVWDALTSDRPYRKAWTADQARNYIREQAGKHFDPQIVEVFLRLLGEEPLPE